MGRQIVDQKILDIASETTKNLNGNKNLNEEIKSKIKAIIVEERVETNTEETNELADIISKNLGIENNSETKIEAKKIRLEIEKWKKENTKDVVDFKKEEFKSRFEEETRKINPDLDEKQLKTVKDYGELIAENYIGDNSLENQKNEALEINGKLFGPGRLENAWSDLEGTVSFLKKSPGEVQNIKSKYDSLKNELTGISLPNNLRQRRSFENIVSNFNGNGDQLFSRTQKYLGWADNVNRLTGGWLNKTVTDAGVKMAGKIGNQAMQEFATNSLNVLAKEGFQKGFQSVLTGILNGGVSATATATAGGAAAGGATVAAGAAVSATGVGAIVVAAMAALKVVKDIGNKIAEKLGISAKKFFEENFGKIGGGILNGIVSVVALPTILLGAVSAVAIGPILIAVFGGLFVYQMFQGSLVSSLVPPKGQGSNVVNNGSGSDLINIGPTKCSVADKVVLTGQCSAQYGNIKMGGVNSCDSNLCGSGCGPTSVSQLLQAKNSTWDPRFLMYDNSSPYSGICSSGTSFKKAQTAFQTYLGKESVTNIIGSCSPKMIKDYICNGYAVMILLRIKGNERIGHYVVAVAVDENDNIIIKDPYDRNDKKGDVVGGKITMYPSNTYEPNSISLCLAVDTNFIK